MSLSLRIFSLFGIPVRLHVSMLIVPFFAFSWVDGSGFASMAFAALLVVLVFGSILAHELGHALTARKFGVHTKDIILTPIGGMARIVNMTTRPVQEILIAVAGPVVSLALAALGFVSLFFLSWLPLPHLLLQALGALLWVNLMLGLFNLIPALPMDGGRILRGALAMKKDHFTATKIASQVGKTIAVVGMVLGGLAMFTSLDFGFSPLNIILISIFVFFSAGQEERMAAFRRAQAQAGAQGGGGPFRSPGWGASPGPPPREEPRARPGSTSDGWTSGSTKSKPAASPRVVVIQGGRAEVISRKDPEED